MGSWFSVNNLATNFRVMCGTRPGDPLADLIFNLAFSLTLKQLQLDLANLGREISLPLAGASIWPRAHEPTTEVTLDAPAFMDDFCVLIFPPAEQILQATTEVVTATAAATSKSGLRLNFASGKSEALLFISGRGARSAKRQLTALDADTSGPTKIYLLPFAADQCLRIVQTYRHLGVTTSTATTARTMVSANLASAAAATSAISRSILSKHRLSATTRTLVAGAVVNSRALFSAGTWQTLPKAYFAKLFHGLASPLRRIAHTLHHKWDPDAPHFSSAEAYWVMGQPHARAQLAAARLRYASRVSKNGPMSLVALLQGPAGRGWRDAIVEDCDLLSRVLPDKLASMPSPQADPRAWEDLWADKAQWDRLIRLFLKAAVEFEFLEAAVEFDSDDEHMCTCCGRVFGTRCRAIAHAAKAHGYRSYITLRVSGTCCPSCGTEFHSRTRLHKHVAAVPGCARFVQALPQLLPAVQHSEDKAAASEYRRARLSGVHRHAGPPAVLGG